MLLFVGVLFMANAVTEKPPVKDVGFEYSINLDTLNFDFVSITSAQVYVYSFENLPVQFITLDVLIFKNDEQVEGLTNFKYPSLISNSNNNLTTVSIEKRSLSGVNYYYRC